MGFRSDYGKQIGAFSLPVYAIETKNLTKVFEKKAKTEGKGLKHFFRRVRPKKEELVAVDHIDLRIKEGELFGLLGPNGAGKTTAIKLLSTLLIPDDGTATVNGYDVMHACMHFDARSQHYEVKAEMKT